jgi:hypothetical protein
MISLDCPDPKLRANAQGIARVAVNDGAAQLIVTFAQPISPQEAYALNPRSYSLTGGQRLFPHIRTATLYNPTGTPPELQGRRVLLQLDGEGDFSIYTLTISGPDIDPFFSSHTLRFRLACDEPFDCRAPAPVLPLAPELPVVIDYLAKDYASFRQALLDFIPTRLPDWTERSEADIGMMLLELFAATADTLSYMQDRVANEAFLSSATQRRSVAGHLALLGYQMDEGAAAYTWLQFQVNAVATLPNDPGLRVSNNPQRDNEPIIVFETLGPVTLRPEHNQMTIYDWGNQQCCLPHTALSVALVGEYDLLQVGDWILFDDGQGHRDIVRLSAKPVIVPADPIKAKPDGPITIVSWSAATPLRYDYCIPDTSARGNLVLATHGETVATPDTPQIVMTTPRLRARLSQAPLAHLDATTLALAGLAPSAPQPSMAGSAGSGAGEVRSISTLKVEVFLPGLAISQPWQELPTLLNSGPTDQVYRVEIDDQGEATIVFGDNTFGQRPAATATIRATYRLGGGTIGNVGADTLVLPQPRATESIAWLTSVTNPLPATGGRDLESRDHARRFGPATFEQPLVAVTAADYQAAAQEFPNLPPASGGPGGVIQRANATFRWTGSWLTVMLAVDPLDAEGRSWDERNGGWGISADLRAALLAYLDGRRLAGYDLEILAPQYAPLDVVIAFCTRTGFRPADVQQALQQALSNADLPGGQKGFFHPDNFSFGDNLYVSRLYAAIMVVPGVESARITRLARLWAEQACSETVANLRQGYLKVGPDEVIRLDNDRNFPQNGTLTIQPLS